jgi:tetratricopeptide (TPR) repeat protein
VSGQTLRVVATQRSLQPEISAAEARASVEPLTKLGDQGVYAPAGPQTKAADDAAAIDSHPSTVDGHVDRGNALLDAHRFAEALAEFDAAIALDAKSQKAWSDRAIAHAWLANPAALADAARADTLGPPEIVAARARALLAANTGDVAGGRAAFRWALTLAPNDAFSLRHLVSLDLKAQDPEAAARDLEALKQADPDLAAATYHLWKASIEQAAGRKDGAERELAQAPADTADALLERARAYLQLGDLERARADADTAIRLKPSVQAWLLRANADGYASTEAAADLEAAARLAPEDPKVTRWRMDVAVARRDFALALKLVETLIAAHGDQTGDLVVLRGQIEAKLGRGAEADADFARARAATGDDAPNLGVLCTTEVSVRWRPATALADCERDLQRAPKEASFRVDRIVLLHRLGREAEAGQALDALEAEPNSASELNTICYALAGEGMRLDRALADCDTSLKLKPGVAATLDSRGFVLMRLGRDAEAQAAYDAALAAQPREYNSLYGRGLVEARMGRADAAARDIHAALAVRPDLREAFEEMGVK